jgi:hypothetical protein
MNYWLDLRSLKRVLILIIFFSSSCAADARLKHFNPDSSIDIKHFGAKGDGVSDDYPAFRAAADYINEKGGGTLVISNGTYFLAPYYTKENPVADIVFRNCRNLNIIGKNAVISVNGKFHRGMDRVSHNYKYSTTKAVIPIRVIDSKDVTISGIEINGNVDKMTRDRGVVEGGGYLVWIQQCENVTIFDMWLHHAQSDGIYIGGGDKPTVNLKISNCTSSNNARQGLSITYLYNGFISHCRFLNTGITDGSYGRHSPAAGVDIEPNLVSNKTGKIVLDSCYFENNLGGQFLCTSPKSTSNVILRNSKLFAKESKSDYQVILAADSVLVENCEMDLGKGTLWPTWRRLPGSNVTISKCVIKSSYRGIVSSSINEKDTVTITNTSLIFTGDTLKSYFPYLQTKNLSFLNNKIYIPSSSIKSKGGATSLVQNALVSKGNKFYSETPATKPKVSYSGTREIKDQ